MKTISKRQAKPPRKPWKTKDIKGTAIKIKSTLYASCQT